MSGIVADLASGNVAAGGATGGGGGGGGKDERREGDDLYEWPRSTCADIHSLLKFLRLKPCCMDALFQRYFIAKDAQLRASKREYGNDVHQTFARPSYMCYCSEGLRTSNIFNDRIFILSCRLCCNTDVLQPMQASSL